jgi:hypothetical protein
VNAPEQKVAESTEPAGVAGGCSLGCAGIFFLLAVCIPAASLFTREGVWFSFSPGPWIAFGFGNVFAWVALTSKRSATQRAGVRALQILWLSLLTYMLGGYIQERFFL